jgi:release factor glutamine methyltransferase
MSDVRGVSKDLGKIIDEAKAVISSTDIYPLLACALGKSKEFIFTYPHYVPTVSELKRWEEFKKRRSKGEPVAYITGEKEFYSLSFGVNSSTLIPRPETELLIDELMNIKPYSLLDIGTGAGNIAVTLKYLLPRCETVGLDISREALEVARHNAERILGEHSRGIRFVHSDYFSAIRNEKFDVLVSGHE